MRSSGNRQEQICPGPDKRVPPRGMDNQTRCGGRSEGHACRARRSAMGNLTSCVGRDKRVPPRAWRRISPRRSDLRLRRRKHPCNPDREAAERCHRFCSVGSEAVARSRCEYLATSSSSLWRFSGLVANSSHPAVKHRSRSPGSEFAVKAMIGAV
jgi:hypothetical protein